MLIALPPYVVHLFAVVHQIASDSAPSPAEYLPSLPCRRCCEARSHAPPGSSTQDQDDPPKCPPLAARNRPLDNRVSASNPAPGCPRPLPRGKAHPQSGP